jgi:hypothetical protein
MATLATVHHRAGRRVVAALGPLVHAAGKARNAYADNVFDLARVRRVPDTTNQKAAES